MPKINFSVVSGGNNQTTDLVGCNFLGRGRAKSNWFSGIIGGLKRVLRGAGVLIRRDMLGAPIPTSITLLFFNLWTLAM